MCHDDLRASFDIFLYDNLSSYSSSATFFQRTANRIGGKYLKTLYFEYTNATFTSRKSRSASEEYLGILGPVIRAEVGDEIHVTFKNMVRKAFPFFLLSFNKNSF